MIPCSTGVSCTRNLLALWLATIIYARILCVPLLSLFSLCFRLLLPTSHYLQEPSHHINSHRHILHRHRLCRVVTDPALAPHKEHRNGHNLGQDHRVVTCPTRQVEDRNARLSNSLRQLLRKEGRASYRGRFL